MWCYGVEGYDMGSGPVIPGCRVGLRVGWAMMWDKRGRMGSWGYQMSIVAIASPAPFTMQPIFPLITWKRSRCGQRKIAMKKRQHGKCFDK